MGLAYLDNAERSNSLIPLLAQHNISPDFLALGCYTLVIDTLSHFHMFRYRQTKGPSQTNFHPLRWTREYKQSQYQIKCT